MYVGCANLQCLQWNAVTAPHSEIATVCSLCEFSHARLLIPLQAFIVLSASVVVMLLLAFYLDQVLPREWGVSQSPLFPIQPLLNCFCRRSADVTSRSNSTSRLVASSDSGRVVPPQPSAFGGSSSSGSRGELRGTSHSLNGVRLEVKSRCLVVS